MCVLERICVGLWEREVSIWEFCVLGGFCRLGGGVLWVKVNNVGVFINHSTNIYCVIHA